MVVHITNKRCSVLTLILIPYFLHHIVLKSASLPFIRKNTLKCYHLSHFNSGPQSFQYQELVLWKTIFLG